MRKWIQAAAVGAALLSSRVAQAQPYNFLVDYFGSGNAVQASGSDNILGTIIMPTDSFFWRISAVGGQWRTTNTVNQFPFMAFSVTESGERNGNYSLKLFSGTTNVLSDVQVGVGHSCAHMGTNSTDLPNALVWDRMELTFTLNSADEIQPCGAQDPNNLQPINSTISSLLPIFGAPEQNQFNPPDVLYETSTVPEPTTIVLMGLGLGVVGVLARRKRA